MLRGKVVMITGAARGIGASMARLLHQRGAHLVLIDIVLRAATAPGSTGDGRISVYW
jgi:NAD(P)-dependent dehydrogenase (short-subunit alcohol dehydrogenase family)